MVKTSIEVPLAVESKILAVLSYFSILCIVPLLLKGNTPFIQHHGRQGLVLFVAQVSAFVCHIFAGAWFLTIFGAVLITYSILGLSQAVNGEVNRLWLLSDIADKITL